MSAAESDKRLGQAQRVHLGERDYSPDRPLARIGMVANTGFYLRQFRLGVMRAMRAAGHELTIVTQSGPHASRLVAEGFHVEYVDIDSHGSSMYRDARLLAQLLRIYRERQLELVFHHTIKPNLFGTIAAQRAGIPSIAVLSGLGSFADLRWGLKRSVTNRLYKWACAHSEEVWFLNDHDRGYFEGRGWLGGTPAYGLRTEGVNLEQYAYHPAPVRAEGEPLRALFAGRMLGLKGVRELAAAARLLHARGVGVEVSMLGAVDPANPDSISVTELEAWISAGTVRYLGEVMDVRRHLAAADVVVQPTRYREGKSRILTEAMAMGRPIITTSRPGAGELVEEGVNGFLVAENDPEELVRVLTRFVNMPPLQRERMGVAGRRAAERDHDERVVVKAYLGAVGRVVRRTKRSFSESPS